MTQRRAVAAPPAGGAGGKTLSPPSRAREGTVSGSKQRDIDPSLLPWTPPLYLGPPPKPVDTATHINLNGLRIGPAHCQSISRAMILNKSVMVLDLSVCDMTDEGCEELVHCLVRNKTLEQLAVNGNFITAAGAKRLAEYIRVTSSLKTLSAACNSMGDEGAVAIAEALKTNRTLDFLNVRGNGISDIGGQALLDAIQPAVNTALTALWFNLNFISAS
jgi:Ran GTPase-activating protein (RanGAP) involved in mRNA processing and transport